MSGSFVASALGSSTRYGVESAHVHHPKSVLTAAPCRSAASSEPVRPLASTEGIAACLSVYNNHATVGERTLIEALSALPVPRNFADAEVGALGVDH
jgi:hypothetical protein